MCMCCVEDDDAGAGEGEGADLVVLWATEFFGWLVGPVYNS